MKDTEVKQMTDAEKAWDARSEGERMSEDGFEPRITKDEREFSSRWASFGGDSVVKKCGRGWVVGYQTCQHPEFFKTKKAASKAAYMLANAIGLRQYGNELK